MRVLSALLLIAAVASAQSADAPQLSPARPESAKQADAENVPVRRDSGQRSCQGCRFHPRQRYRSQSSRSQRHGDPRRLTHPASAQAGHQHQNAREGDSVYAETVFPFVLNERLMVPAGTYIQGKITHVQRAGRVRGRSELLMHFTSMIYPSGYTVMLPGSVENTPGADDKTVKDKEGTIQQDKNTGNTDEDAAKGGAIGTMGGATAGGLATGG